MVIHCGYISPLFEHIFELAAHSGLVQKPEDDRAGGGGGRSDEPRQCRSNYT